MGGVAVVVLLSVSMFGRAPLLSSLLLGLSLVSLVYADCPTKGDPIHLIASQDATVSQKSPHQSFGHTKTLQLDAGGEDGTDQLAYIGFDLTGLRLGSLGSCTLSLEVWGAQRGLEGLRPGHVEDLPLKVRTAPVGFGASFSEGSLTWSNRPVRGLTELARPHRNASVAVTAAGQALILSLDVTTEVGQALMAGGSTARKHLIFELSLEAGAGSHNVAGFYSREDRMGMSPTLRITDESCRETWQSRRAGGEVFHQIQVAEDATVRGGAWSTVNHGHEPLLSIHNGGGKDEYRSYIKFMIPEALRNPKGFQLGRAEVRINKWRGTPEHEADDIKVNMVHESFDEDTVTSSNAPKAGWAVLYCNKGAILMPNDMYVKIDLTDEFHEALKQSRRSFMIQLSRKEGKQALAGTAPLAFHSKESGNGPSLSVQMLNLNGDPTAQGHIGNGENAGSTSDLW